MASGLGPMRSICSAGAGMARSSGISIQSLQALVVRDHENSRWRAHLEFADHGGMRALENLDDLAIGAAAGLDARDAHHDAVAVHGAARLHLAGI